MSRRWWAGQEGYVGGMLFRVVPGAKGPNDLRLDWRIQGIWRPVPMKVVAFMTDFFYDNEDALYPPPAQGGEFFITYLRQATVHGFKDADRGLRDDQAMRQYRDED